MICWRSAAGRGEGEEKDNDSVDYDNNSVDGDNKSQ